MRFRFFLLIGGTALIFVFLSSHLYRLQITQGEYYTEQAHAQSLGGEAAIPRRGNIFITNQQDEAILAALTKEYPTVYAVPKEVLDSALVSFELSEILGLEQQELVRLLSKPDDEYELLSKRVTDDQLKQLLNKKIQGVYVATEKSRFYPFDTLGSQVLGFVGLNKEDEKLLGRYGVELQFQEILAGTPARAENGEVIAAVPGGDILLTIDRSIQVRAEEILLRVIKQYRADGGSVIVQDPRDGTILAMANYPTFDPNTYSEFPVFSFKNLAVEGMYEPGSVFKVITMAAGLDSGKITPETTYYDSGEVTLDGKTIKNWDHKAHGTLTMTQVIENSVNTGSIFAQRKIGQELFYNYLVKFGFKELTGIQLPNEAVGRLTPLERYVREVNFATASYGQGISTTPLALIRAISAIANHGVMNKPTIIADDNSSETRQVVSPEAARQVVDMMVNAVDKNVLAAISSYDVAGKTGTAFIPKDGGYSENVINTYVGFAPAYDPRFTILIKVDNPEGAPLAGQTVVPAFRELAEFILNYYNIPPSRVR